ncbi:MAG: hypothetical protein M3319_01240, partial [Actinomycetota bacterium]|nr:hypothetical protein [Actinomycetota bacterium]
GYGQRLSAQPPELGKMQRRQRGSFTDESITGWETILQQQTSTRAAAITVVHLIRGKVAAMMTA